MATSRIVGGRAIDRFINIIENAVKEFEGGDDTPDELSPRTFSIAKAGGYEEIMLSDIDSFDESTDGPAVLIIDGGREKQSASTAEPGLRRLFQMMQHVRPTFSDRKTGRTKAAKKKAAKKAARKKVAERTAKHVEDDNGRGHNDDNGNHNDDNHNNGNHTKDDEHAEAKHNKTAKVGRAEFCILGGVTSDSDSAADDSDNSAADSSDDSGDNSDRDDRPCNRKRKDDKIRVKRGPRRLIKIRNTDLYKYTDTVTDEPDDDYVNDYNVAVEVDKMGLRGELLPFERARRGKVRE